ncbi:unnamed protein product [Psylliodes chrysocephalus]|uniref:Uncharacterized protein n=1 Tax=Psylliodes chrysocephalus TaxID=3402493 RepID=A0A9P0G7B2_9CUCU|nr:unnamed protein product [Psylliodes chrysocephala]
MNGILSPKTKKHKQNQNQKEDMKEQIVAQVHKSVLSNTNSDNDYANNSETESNRTYTKYEDKNENISMHTPSREISVDGETQINSKIMSLIETEMRRDINRHSHFTDSRPQSLSFYEDEKIPEELSGNLELLSPEERKHYRKRKEYLQMDNDELNAYNTMQAAHNGRDPEDIMTTSLKKSKSKKKRHGGDAEMGIGDSREMMIPKEKKKSKKKRRDVSPANSSSTKRKHKKREEEYDLRNDIAVALEELQDDVFETNPDFNAKPEKMKKSPRKSDKLYVQRKTKFEVTGRPSTSINRPTIPEMDDNKFGRRIDTAHLEKNFFRELWVQKRNSLIAFIYMSCLIIHLTTFIWDDEFSRLSYQDFNNENSTEPVVNVSRRDINIWNHLSLWRSLLAFTAWIFVGLGPPEDSLYHHLKTLEAYLPNK